MQDRYEKAAANQSLFRDVNERIADLSAGAGTIDVVCECADTGCSEPISLTQDEYEAVRRDPNRFPIKPGHEDLDVERVTGRNDRYCVVEKIASGAAMARELDPRRPGDATV